MAQIDTEQQLLLEKRIADLKAQKEIVDSKIPLYSKLRDEVYGAKPAQVIHNLSVDIDANNRFRK